MKYLCCIQFALHAMQFEYDKSVKIVFDVTMYKLSYYTLLSRKRTNKGVGKIVRMHRLVCAFVVCITKSGYLWTRPI